MDTSLSDDYWYGVHPLLMWNLCVHQAILLFVKKNANKLVCKKLEIFNYSGSLLCFSFILWYLGIVGILYIALIVLAGVWFSYMIVHYSSLLHYWSTIVPTLVENSYFLYTSKKCNSGSLFDLRCESVAYRFIYA